MMFFSPRSLRALLHFPPLKGHAQFRRMAFFTLAWPLVLCDLVTQSVQLAIVVPVTFAGEAVYGHPFWYYAVLFFDTVAYNATLHFSGLLTLNRVCVFFLPRLNHWLFLRPRIFITIGALWAYVFAFCSCYNLIGCRKAFSESGFYLYHDCPAQLPSWGQLFRQISFALSTYLPLVMLGAYVAIFVHLRYFCRTDLAREHGPAEENIAPNSLRERQKYERQRRTQEIHFLVQVSILLNSISPPILFLFNADVRKCVYELLRLPQHQTGSLSRRVGAVPGARVAFTRSSVTIPPSELLRPRPTHFRHSVNTTAACHGRRESGGHI